MKNRYGIISYSDKLSLPTSLNHQFYADTHKYTYILDISPCPAVDNKTLPIQRHGYFSKIQKIKKFICLFDWVMWIDDDVLITDHTVQLESIIKDYSESDLLICNSPVSPTGKWTYINSGVFLMKNTPRSLEFLNACLQVDFKVIEDWWDNSKLGHFTKADQDAIVYQLIQNPKFNMSSGFWSKLDYSVMNSRDYHYADSSVENFILHLAGVPSKINSMADFSLKFQVNPLFVPDDVVDAYRFNKDIFHERNSQTSNYLPAKNLNKPKYMNLFKRLFRSLKNRLRA